ncbi:MAG: hypothetical protein IJR14_05310, partial [Synergistaceae bacterium]|nr:hypothetical protein [Synergistaceae bacterium]
MIFRDINDIGMNANAIAVFDPSDVYVVFSPTQIKSATDNRGTFDAGDLDIYHQLLGERGAEAITREDVAAVQAIPGKSVNEFTSEETQGTENWARKFYRELGIKSPYFRASFGDWRANDQSAVTVVPFQKGNGKIPRGDFINDDTGWTIKVSGTIERETKAHALRDGSYDILGNIEEIIRNAVLLDTRTEAKGKAPYRAFMHSFYSVAQDAQGNVNVYKLFVDEIYMRSADDGTMRRAYQLKKLDEICGMSARDTGSAVSSSNAAPSGDGNRLPGTETNIPSSASIKTVSDLFGIVKANDASFRPKEASKVIDANGEPLVLFHQTDAEIRAFDVRHPGAGTRDMMTPYGVFMKPTDKDIGLGKRQMALYAKITAPLTVESAETLQAMAQEASPEYAAALADLNETIDLYSAMKSEAQTEIDSLLRRMVKARDGETTEALQTLQARFDEVIQQIRDYDARAAQEGAALRKSAKEAMTAWLKESGYDGVIIEQDQGSGGRSTKTFIALSPEQVKSATDNRGTFDAGDPDIYHQDKERPKKRGARKSRRSTFEVKKSGKDGGALRGQVEFLREARDSVTGEVTQEAQAIITLMRMADPSTFPHEMWHVCLDDLMLFGRREDAPEHVRKDWETVTEWLGVRDLDYSLFALAPEARRGWTAEQKARYKADMARWHEAQGRARHHRVGAVHSGEADRGGDDMIVARALQGRADGRGKGPKGYPLG